MNKPYDVLVVGELNVDLILNQVDKFPEIGKEVLADNMTLTMGSSSAIFASNLSTVGSRVAFIGRLGHDNFGDHILASLQSRGVDTTHILRSTAYNTGATIVLNFGEDRAMVTYPGAMKHLTLQDITPGVLQKARHLHLSSVFLQSGLQQDIVALFKGAKDAGLTTSLDPQWDPAERWDIDLPQLLPHVDVFMPNINELKAFTSKDDLTAALDAIKSFARNVVVKHGSDGAYLWNGRELLHQPAFLNKDVVDSIGAGDSFDSGFIHKFISGAGDQACLEFGALTGAINTTRPGGTGAFESLALVKTIAATSFNYSF
ncbi:carbohydrate kinase family protein [Dawidia soli]|uniref:Carbohydrate kinase family protein n=1 Tax=Dawidia soli TaxID=2782352 RepID=A0AAP2DCL2_9BACT|nr:carbohydrate kinase family protein [Dawidia soli]MBT1689553.1 carbohydrate kinase family protein [Dawidia soli]